MDLVVGATGFLGTEICRLLKARERRVRALVRQSSAPERVHALRDLGVEIVVGDLKDRGSLERACRDVRNVLSTATSTRSRAEGDDIESVDRVGHLNLIESAKGTGVHHFTFTSFCPLEQQFPLQQAKRDVEQRLAGSGMAFSILQPCHFIDVWFTPKLGFDAQNRRARMFGRASRPIRWVWLADVARVAAEISGNAGARGETLLFGGPSALSQREVVRIFERRSGQDFALEQVPAEALTNTYTTSRDSLELSFAAMMLSCSAGQPTPPDSPALHRLLDFKPNDAEAYAARVLEGQ